jgi:SNF2 family DNA or RNA helicase
VSKSVPDFLQPPSFEGHKYGELTYKNNRFRIAGEPILLEFAKRVFPGARVYKRKSISFPGSFRIISDLNWLMMRFPVEVKCKEYETTRAAAVDRYLRRANGEDRKRTVPPAGFLGKLYPYQEVAVSFLATNRRAILGDGMGLGKTWSALGAAATVAEYPVLVVCQTHVQLQWQRVIGALFNMHGGEQLGFYDSAFELACRRGTKIAPILKGQKPYKIPETPFSITHYGLLQWWGEALRERGYSVVIFDEIQELRHIGTQKYSQASLLSDDATYVWGLSGTPVYGYGSEIWSVLNAVEFHCLGSQEAFTREWCTGYGEKIVENPQALNGQLVREGYMLRRKAEDVSIELPKVVRHVQDVDHDRALFDDLIGNARAMADSYKLASFTAKGQISRDIERESRLASGISKANFVADFVAALLESGERPLVYAWHHRVHDILRERLQTYWPASITGRETASAKAKNLQRYIDGKTNLVILSLRSAAGLDGLQHRATCCVFAELDWSPAVHGQAETRIARIGVDKLVEEVPSYYCVARNGYDEVMIDVLGVKTSQFVGLMGDEPEDREEAQAAEERAQRRIQKLIDRLKHQGGSSESQSAANQEG